MGENKTLLVPALFKAFLLGWGMVIFYVILNSCGALALKAQVQKLGRWNFTTVRSYISYFFVLFSSWQSWVGLGALLASNGAWVIALASLELSKAYPVAIAMNLLMVVSLSIIFNQEVLSYYKILGVVLITLGALVLFK